MKIFKAFFAALLSVSLATSALAQSRPTVNAKDVNTTGNVNVGGSLNLPSKSANNVFAAPSGVAGIPLFRALVAADIPALDTGKITTGLLPVARGGTGAATGAASLMFATPSGGSGAPSFRSLVAGDIPSLPYVLPTTQATPLSFAFGMAGVLNAIVPGFENNTYLYSANPIGRAGSVAFTRSSDNPTVGDSGTQAVTGFTEHDSAKNAWVFYGEMRRRAAASAYYAHMNEMNGLQFGADAALTDPYDIYAAGQFDAYRATAGRTDAAGSTFSMSAALQVAANGAKFLKGIVFGNDSIVLNSGQGDVINVAIGHALQQWVSAATRGSRIRFDTTTANNAIQLIFGNGSLVLQNYLAVTFADFSTTLATLATPIKASYMIQGEAAVNLVNGANNNVTVALGQVWSQGPTGAFSITGIVALQAGAEITVLNDTGQNITLAHENASSTAANRIWSSTGADIVSTGNAAFVLRYSGIKSRWMVVSSQL